MVKKSDKKDSNAKRNHSKDHNLLRENIASVPSNKINYIYLNTLHWFPFVLNEFALTVTIPLGFS